MVVPRLMVSATSGFDFSSIFVTDVLKGGAGTGFGGYQSGCHESSFRPREPSGVFGMVVIWEDMLTLFGLFHFCLGLSVLTATKLSSPR
jgi:hypothetical protein